MPENFELCYGCFQEPRAQGACPGCGFLPDPGAFPTALRPGLELSRYIVGRVLGKPGGFGITYLAFDPVLDRRLALKELMPRELVARRHDGQTLQIQTRDDEKLFEYTRSSFLSEARTIAQLSHPNLVRVLDYFEANGTAYFAMEYYEGATLAEVTMAAGGRLPPQRAVSLVLPILDALDYIHRRPEPILHRDIKPANIYVTVQGAPILLDFGAARVAMGQQSRSLSAVLTPGFAPYEQYSTRGNQGPWTDVYGLSATLYFLLTGSSPPEASTRVEDPTVEAPERIAPGIPSELSDAVLRGLAFRPQDRPQSARELSERVQGRVPSSTDDSEEATRLHVPGTLPVEGIAAGADTVRETGGSGATRFEEPDDAQTMVAATPFATTQGRRRSSLTPVALAGAGLLVAAGAFALVLSGWPGGEGGEAPEMVIDQSPMDPLEGDSPSPDMVDPESVVRPADGSAGEAPRAPNGPTLQGQQAAPDQAQQTGPDRGQDLPRAEAAPAQGEPLTGPGAPPGPTPARGVLVVIYGDEPASARQAETTILQGLVSHQGVETLDPSALSIMRGDQSAVEAANRGDFAALAALGRSQGAEFLVVGDLSSRGVPSVGRFFTGTAEIDLKMYRVSTGSLVRAETFLVGGGGAQAALAPSEGEARTQAAREAAAQAATAARRWLDAAFR